jgi:hypothetical protein
MSTEGGGGGGEKRFSSDSLIWSELSDIKRVKQLVKLSNETTLRGEFQKLLVNIKVSLINEDLDAAFRLIEEELKNV